MSAGSPEPFRARAARVALRLWHPALILTTAGVYCGGVPSESYFMAFGGLGLSLAGFAGLISALTRRPSTNMVLVAYRVRTIVFLGFSLTFVGFVTVALYSVTGADVPATVRAGTLLMTIPFFRG